MPNRPIQAVRDLSAPWHVTGVGQAAALALTIAAFAWSPTEYPAGWQLL